MPIKIGSNILSLNTQRHLAESTDAVGAIYERLSSGMRINKSSDDAAGLAIASTLNAQSRISSQSIRNVNDGVSLLNIAEGALSELTNISIRIEELAVQSANGTFSGKQRLALQAESDALVSEFNRIVGSVSFNGTTLLDGDLGRLSIQLGIGEGSFSDRQISVGLTDGLKRNVGTGTLNTGVSFAIGADVIGVAAADFNADGKVDYAVNGADGQLRIFTGNGDGTFGTGQVIASGVRELETADLNNDGIMDLITVSPNSLITFMGNGNATFSSGRTFFINGNNLNGIGDFNKDGILDLLSYGEGGASVMFGNGNGSFGAATVISAAYTDSAKAVDLDKDGNIDLITAVADAVRVQMGNGNGTFGAIRTIETGLGGTSARDMEVIDMNGDGYEDIVVTAYGTDQVRIILGNGNGTFGARTSITSVDAHLS